MLPPVRRHNGRAVEAEVKANRLRRKMVPMVTAMTVDRIKTDLSSAVSDNFI